MAVTLMGIAMTDSVAGGVIIVTNRIALVRGTARGTKEKIESEERERTQPNQEDAGHSVLLREGLIWLKLLSSPLNQLRKAAYSLAKQAIN
ncbi:MAG: hypothetical protein K2Y32_01620 [Candidatus Obscuribacterales bacterium]|nr:hypothetical protein [Candidatus Obscuribacterales bacterium]